MNKGYTIEYGWRGIEKLYGCNYCNHGYIKPKSIKRHLKKVHEEMIQ